MTSPTVRGIHMLLVLTCLLAAQAGAQASEPAYNCDERALPHPKAAQSAPSYEIRQLPRRTVESVRNALKNSQWVRAISLYFTQYQPQLPTWVVYIDAFGQVGQCVIGDNHTGPIVRGKRIIWAMVFSERPMVASEASQNKTAALIADTVAKRIAASAWHIAVTTSRDSPNRVTAFVSTDTAAKAAADRLLSGSRTALSTAVAESDTLDLRLARRNVLYKKDPVLLSLIKGLAKGLSLDPGAGEDAKFEDSVRTIDLRQVSEDSTNPLWVGFGRIGLAEGAQIELALRPSPGKEFPSKTRDSPAQLENVYTNILDVREHVLELGLIAGWSRGWHVPTYDSNLRLTNTSTVNDVGVYLTAFINAPWRHTWVHFPWNNLVQRTSVGLFGGTNVLTGNLDDKYIAGVSAGHLWGDLGLSVGQAWVPTKQLRGNALVSVRQRRWIVGLDFRL